MFAFSLCLFLLTFNGIFCEDSTVIVETEQGKVEGSLSSNGLYHEFLGIPYGVPVKFRAPQDPPEHEEVFKADNRLSICPQFPSNDPLALPSDNEDCLTLNIYSPINSINTTLPVMVYLHGGGFGIGSGSPTFYGPQYLVSHGVVIVTINYRLNVYGFLNLGTKEAPGNAGLKDIRQALRWIKKNIASFGGDEENVTVFGQGSGGIAAIYLTLSESCKGLFNRIISESGSLFTPHSFDHKPLATASQIAKSLGVNSEDSEELFKLYSDTPITKVEEAISKQMNAKSVFLPSVESIFEDEEAFLTDTPYNILTTKNHKSFNPVPIIIGINTVEGLTSTLDYNTITSQMDRIKNEDYSSLDQRNFEIPDDEKEEFRDVLKETYFSNTTSDETVVGGIINLNSDFSFVGPLSLFTELYSNVSGQAIYEYIFNYIGNRNLGRLLTNSSLPATANQDELFYIFELERVPLPMDENDARIVTFMTMMWTNFAKFGNPTPEPENGSWLPHPHNLAIALEPQYVAPLTPERAHFWKTLYMKYGADVPREAEEEM
ncbi:juvenile hormone esterase-like [Pectinophora gossypiella]|uniref:juvenile hormone esterase-like n=1 Tax=Pectinophora gossypiella TaxID=13191 RepID=UPI00214DF964|nr:juvenile hormone esterase-like [Pectinophora gossypiella]